MFKNRISSNSVLMLVSLALLTVNILLVYQNLTLRSELGNVKEFQITNGDEIERFKGKDLGGNVVQIEYSANPKRLFLYFKSNCGYCKDQMKFWQMLASKIDREQYEVAAITIEEDKSRINSYLQEYNLTDTQTYTIPRTFAAQSKLNVTPTFVVGKDGLVEKVWIGVWGKEELEDAGRYFGVNFQ